MPAISGWKWGQANGLGRGAIDGGRQHLRISQEDDGRDVLVIKHSETKWSLSWQHTGTTDAP